MIKKLCKKYLCVSAKSHTKRKFPLLVCSINNLLGSSRYTYFVILCYFTNSQNMSENPHIKWNPIFIRKKK